MHRSVPRVSGGAIAVIAALLLLAAACGGATPGVEDTPTAIPQPTPGRPIPVILLGDTAVAEDAEMTIHGVRRSTQEGDESLRGDEEWLLVEMTVRNTAMEPFIVFAHLVHPDGSEYERAWPATATPELDEPVPPSAEVRGEMAFLVSVHTLGPILIYGPGEERWALQMGLILQPTPAAD